MSKKRKKQKSKTVKEKRVVPKSRVFSVSMRINELTELQCYLDAHKSKTGFELSRNEFIRRAALSAKRILNGDEREEFSEVFKRIGG